MVESGILSQDMRLLVSYVTRFPGCTLPELAWHAAREHEGDTAASARILKGPEWWRQKLGRRANEAEKAGLISRRFCEECGTAIRDEMGVAHAKESGHITLAVQTRDGCARWWPVKENGRA
jgi:hypothetical protein